MNFAKSSDNSLLAFYECVRHQVKEDMLCGGRYRFASDGVKRYADRLREEMDHRSLRFTPIDWS
jgi:hypothetical protein